MKILILFLSLSIACLGQVPHFNHIIFVIQENRTPDNLLGACNIPGADIQQIGNAGPLNTAKDLTHTHAAFLSDAAGLWQSGSKNYVQLSDISPYCQIALQYGFANRFFQTNQGPSGPAHHFLFEGTSARYEGDSWMEAENPAGTCVGLLNTTVKFIDPQGNENHTDSPCLNPSTLTDELDVANISWKYYAPSASNIWTAPAAIRHICLPVSGQCTGPDWAKVDLTPNHILSDINNGTLAQVSWVVPAGKNSDHPTYGNGGPAWVASIVNTLVGTTYWDDTVIFILWDDWGGWYDHVPPLVNATGFCQSYCYGFRVPLMVVSQVTPINYISNNIMDFGSLLLFVEDNFSLGLIGNGLHADAYSNPIDPGFFYAPKHHTLFVKARSLTKEELESKSDPDEE